MDTDLLFDVIVVGGGPAGCATALSIARHDTLNHLRVLVIDDADPDAFKVGESLPAVAKRTLSLLDPSLPARMAEDTKRRLHAPCTGNASAWASERLHETYSLMNPYGSGWHLDRARFDETLREACQGRIRKGKFVAVRRVDEPDGLYGWEVNGEMRDSGKLETFRARCIVDATGRRASVARKVGAVQRKSHDLLAFYLVFDTAQTEATDSNSEELDGGAPVNPHDRDDRTLIEATPSGWWYTARLPQGQRLVTYTTNPSDPTARVARTSAGFMDMLASQTHHIAKALGLGAGAVEDPPAYEVRPETRFTRSTAAGSSVLEPYAGWELPTSDPNSESGASGVARGRGWCAAGDAALAFDPLSSQGIITSLNSGLFLGGMLVRHLCPTVADDAEAASGEVLVRNIEAAYEKVRVKYEEGRAYYYNVVRRFDAGSVDSGGSEDTHWQGFWKVQRDE